ALATPTDPTIAHPTASPPEAQPQVPPAPVAQRADSVAHPPPRTTPHPNPDAALATPTDPTIAHPTASPPEAQPQVPPAPVAQRADSVAHPPPQHADSDQTQYITAAPSSASDIVGVLVAIDGELKGQMFRVSDGENRLGRRADCEIELNSQKISREHAILIHRDGKFVIKPLSDKNPTFLNEMQTTGNEVGDGDTIRIGLTTLKFRSI
ncbi:MAG: FHA domain-containing protein, partial [Myxococcota bacterium]